MRWVVNQKVQKGYSNCLENNINSFKVKAIESTVKSNIYNKAVQYGKIFMNVCIRYD